MDEGRTERTVAWVLVAAGMVAAIAGGIFSLYGRFLWYDEVVHAYNFFALTLLSASYAQGVVLKGGREHGFLLVLFLTIFGLGLGALWEIAEFAYDKLIALQADAILPKFDTILDMILDTGGALVAALVHLWTLRK